MATGFPALDRVIGGGLRTRNLTLIGGSPGIGKTITALQMARNLAHKGQSVIFRNGVPVSWKQHDYLRKF